MSGFLELLATCSVVGGARVMHGLGCEGLVVQAGIMRPLLDGTGLWACPRDTLFPLRNPWGNRTSITTNMNFYALKAFNVNKVQENF